MDGPEVSELKQESRWTLASDEKILSVLRNFSTDIADKTKKLVDKIDEIDFEVYETEVKLRNTFNEFLILANTQFIENVS